MTDMEIFNPKKAGHTRYRAHWENLPPLSSKGYEMGKISDSGNTLEYIWASEDYPIEEWEPDKFEYNYRIYTNTLSDNDWS